MAFDVKELQSGNLICGAAEKPADGTEDEIVLTKEVAGRVGGSFVYWLSQNVQKNPTMLRIIVGCDPRLSGEELKEGVLEAASLWGAEGYDAGIVTTGAMKMAATMPQYEFDGAVMITGGEMPSHINGFRFFTADDEPDSEDIAEILRLASKYNFIGGSYDEKKEALMPMQAAFQRQALSRELSKVPGVFKDMHIVVDAGNGAGGYFAADVLGKLGADISGSYNLETDGESLSRTDDPEVVCEMKKTIAKLGADLGIIFSPDAGRFAAVTYDDIITADGDEAVSVVADAVFKKAGVE